MAQKNESRRKYLQAKAKASREIYVTKRTEANRDSVEIKREIG
jgi:hypothetical protein